MELIHQRTSEKILRGFYNVYNNLGYGFSEKVYENALVMELSGSGLICNKQKQLKVHYNGQVVGEYFADIIVDDSVILELKSASALIPEHEAQLLNYLRATEMELGFLLNFGERPQFKRLVFRNSRKFGLPQTI